MTKAADFKTVITGVVADIRLSSECWREYQGVLDGTDERSVRRRRALARYFEQFCARRPHLLNNQQYKRQGAFPDGKGATVSVFEFKAWQWRLYGAVLTVAGKECFVGVRVDPDKKQDKADPQILKAAAADIGALEEHSASSASVGKTNAKQAPRRRG